MNEQELAELQKACDSATPGPWHVVEMDDDYCMSAVAIATRENADDPPGEDDGDNRDRIAITLWQAPRIVDIADGKWDENAAFIALARNALPTLLAMVRELKAAIQDITDSTSGCVLETCSIVPCDRCMAVAKAYSLLSAPAAKGCKKEEGSNG